MVAPQKGRCEAPGEPLLPLEVRWSVDLVAACSDQLEFLRAVHAYPRGALYDDVATLSAALSRYGLFLRLLSAWVGVEGTEPLEPPLDVAWLWHLHKLNPRAYKADCINLHGRLLDLPPGSKAFAFSTTEKPGAFFTLPPALLCSGWAGCLPD